MNELRERATLDSLTRLYNRDAFFRLAVRDLSLHVRTHLHLCVMMLDIDHFKHVNDTYGHQTGDVVLREIAAVLKQRLRQTDILGRYGGEEFCVLLPQTDAKGARRIAREICDAVAAVVFHADGTDFHVTISIGMPALDESRHTDVDGIIADADTALYRAKETGRNRVVMYTRGGLTA